MDYSYIFDRYGVDYDLLLKYGFISSDNKYIYKSKIDEDDFSIEVVIEKESIFLYVYNDGEEYLPIYVKDSSGEFVNKIRSMVDRCFNDIVDKCFINLLVKDKVIGYVKNKYDTDVIYPFKDSPYISLNTKSGKWYGLIMNISARKLGLDRDDSVDIINLKNNEEDILNIIDNKNIFRAYHMNKKYWISVILSNKIDFNIITDLIDTSYNLVIN